MPMDGRAVGSYRRVTLWATKVVAVRESTSISMVATVFRDTAVYIMAWGDISSSVSVPFWSIVGGILLGTQILLSPAIGGPA